jgi:hypothetical protein
MPNTMDLFQRDAANRELLGRARTEFCSAVERFVESYRRTPAGEQNPTRTITTPGSRAELVMVSDRESLGDKAHNARIKVKFEPAVNMGEYSIVVTEEIWRTRDGVETHLDDPAHCFTFTLDTESREDLRLVSTEFGTKSAAESARLLLNRILNASLHF